jgi:sulfonate transport system substrate-binding protein
MKRRNFLLLTLTSPLLSAVGCRPTSSGSSSSLTGAAPSPAEKGGGSVLRIGYQKATALDVLRLRGDLNNRLQKEGIRVEWVTFPAGPQILEAMNGGSIDLASMGDAPPIFGQAAGIPFVYVANQPPGSGGARAILVLKQSSIHSVSDLRGKRLAVQKASGTHNFVIQALEKAGVGYNEVQWKFLAPADGRAAFESGSVDAWGVWDPFLAAAEEGGLARVLIDGSGIVTSGDFYLASRAFAKEHPDEIKAVLEEVDTTAKWIDAHPRKAAEVLAAALAVDANKLEVVQARAHRGAKHIGLRPIDDSIIATQQKVADVFLRAKLLPTKVDVREALLTPEQYTALTPSQVSAR